MSDVPTFLSNLQAEFDAATQRDTTYLAQALVRSLKTVSSVRTLFMEGSFTFMTTANQQEYPTGRQPGTTAYVGPTPTVAPPAGYVVGVPQDLQEMDSFYVLSGNVFGLPGIPIERGTIQEIRAVALRFVFPGIYTSKWCFHHEAILLGPIPAGSQQLAGDYLRDATRDSATGAVITTALIAAGQAAGLTNPWLDGQYGEFALRALVLRDYFSGLAKDDQMKDHMTEAWQDALSTFSSQVSQAKSASSQAPRSFGESSMWGGDW